MVQHGTRILIAGGTMITTQMATVVLGAAGYHVAEVADVAQILPVLASYQPSLLVLEVSPERAAIFRGCRSIRSLSDLPLIVISSEDAVELRVHALQAGADVYLATPFEPAELLARITALLWRRTNDAAMEAPPISYKGFTLDAVDYVLHRTNGASVALSSVEFRLLACLIQHAGSVVTMERIRAYVWDREPVASRNQVAIIVRRLRVKVEADPQHPRHITTVRGAGYRFE